MKEYKACGTRFRVPEVAQVGILQGSSQVAICHALMRVPAVVDGSGWQEPEGAAAFMEALTDRYLLYTKSGGQQPTVPEDPTKHIEFERVRHGNPAVPDDCYPVTLTPGDGVNLESLQILRRWRS